MVEWNVTKSLERGQKWNGVPIFPCKIRHGQENNGMMSDWHWPLLLLARTMIEAAHVLDRQAGGIQMGVVRQEELCVRHEVLRAIDEWVS